MQECERVLEALEASGQYRYADPAFGLQSDADWLVAAYKTACLKRFPLAMAFWPGDRTANTLASEAIPPAKAAEYLTLTPDASRVPISTLCPPGKFGVPQHAKHGAPDLPYKSPADAMACATGGIAEEFCPPEQQVARVGALAADLAHLQISEPAAASNK